MAHPPDKVFREALHAALRRKAISQRDLATQVGVKPGTLKKYLHGKTRLDDAVVRRLSEILGVPVRAKNAVETAFREVVRRRIQELGLSPQEVGRRVAKEMGLLEYLEGEATLSHAELTIVADALEIDPPSQPGIYEGLIRPGSRNTSGSVAAFELSIDPSLTQSQVRMALDALAELFRAAGGIGLSVEFEVQEAQTLDYVDA